MADEILKDELLDEAQLDKVAGGTSRETNNDFYFMYELHRNGDLQFSGDTNMMKEMQRVWAKFGVSVIHHNDDRLNEYYNSNGEQISRRAALEHILQKTNSKVNIKYFL